MFELVENFVYFSTSDDSWVCRVRFLKLPLTKFAFGKYINLNSVVLKVGLWIVHKS